MHIKHSDFQSLKHIDHAFFTRKGGVSEGVYESFNFGYGSQDKIEHILKNYEKAALQLQADFILTCRQIHSDKVITVEQIWTKDNRPEADAMVTYLKNVPLGILTADCGPVLFADQNKNIIGAAHLGRKGALSGLLFHTVDAMEKIGASRKDIIAVLGPTISKENYEVDAVIYDDMRQNHPAYLPFIHRHFDKKDHFLLDIPGIIQHQAHEAGITFLNLNECTYHNSEFFFSYRKATHLKLPDCGRLLSAIKII
ncbi:MAG: peptidoglycan editing factor PgeF [Pseudomonadota bacterium]